MRAQYLDILIFQIYFNWHKKLEDSYKYVYHEFAHTFLPNDVIEYYETRGIF